VKWLIGFGRFWYDFLVGDSVLLAIGGVTLLALGFGLAEIGATGVAQIALPVAAVATLSASFAWRRGG
jgi:hypothetical protein